MNEASFGELNPQRLNMALSSVNSKRQRRVILEFPLEILSSELCHKKGMIRGLLASPGFGIDPDALGSLCY